MRLFPGFLVLAGLVGACASDSPVAPNQPSLLIGPPPGCSLPYLTSGILQPINADNSSSFQLGRTIPVKIRITDCTTGDGVNTLAPNISLALIDQGGGPVNELISSSAADDGTTMRSAGDGQYIFNLSTKRSQFNAGDDLFAGVYQLTISSPGQFEDVVVQFSVRRSQPFRPEAGHHRAPASGARRLIAPPPPSRRRAEALDSGMSPPWPFLRSAGLLLLLLSRVAAAQVAEPPNAPAIVTWTGGHLHLTYDGVSIFDGVIRADSGALELRTLTDTAGGVVTQIFKWTVRGDGQAHLNGTVFGSGEAFSAEAEPRQNGLRVVRNRTGFGTNRGDRAVYDRRRDWVLSVDFPAGVSIAPLSATQDSIGFRLEASGGEVALRFRPRYYGRHRGLTWYRPWTYRPWQPSVAGWTSWYAFRDAVTEADIHRTADVLAERLLRYGFEYLQIDDGYQSLPIGVPDHWLTANPKFPAGLDALRSYIAGRGLRPGIWTNVSFQDRTFAESHPGYFVPDSAGPALGNWVGFVMDGSTRATLDSLVRPVYQALARSGWDYFKVDALRHLLYEGYNSHAEYFRSKGVDRVEVYRAFVQAIRDAIGRRVFMLGCWGIRPELIGIVDAVRVGDDGFGYGGFAQYNSFNNVVWRNDPDHIELSRADAFRATTLASLTGSLLMLTDPPEVYRTDRVEAARRAAPVLFTVPSQLYDVDPSRSERIAESATTLSGSGPRSFDAEQRLVANLYQLDLNRPFGAWTVLARTAGAPATIRLGDLGLLPGRDYAVFEFWSKRLVGFFKDSLRAGPIDPRYQVQVLCIRERTGHPQLLATNRHVTCGGPDVQRVSWNGAELEGESTVVAGDRYELYLSEPAGYRFVSARVEGGTVQSSGRDGALRTVRITLNGGGTIRWRVKWKVYH